MKIEPFEMERMQSTWENVVKFNMSESGVHPVPLEELIAERADRSEFLQIELGYSQSNGTPDLRQKIAAMYPGATGDNVLVTHGTAEANFIATWLLTELGDEVIITSPNYMQIWGVARGFGAEVSPLRLVEEKGWAPDLDEFERSVTKRTKLIAVCNPNNPTGAILSKDEMKAITNAARRANAWLLVDEVYRGAERVREMTPSFWGAYDKVIITSGLSKAYGLPGLRIGWLVSTSEFIAKAWSHHDYTTIGPSPLTDFLARIALRPAMRESLLARTRRILNANYPMVQDWVNRNSDVLSLIDPQAGAIVYVKHSLDLTSGELVERLNHERSLLIVPGEHFRMGKYLRIGYGAQPQALEAGLRLIEDFIAEVRRAS
jgi:aspartate/methionine/tyrosine aminotransferase